MISGAGRVEVRAPVARRCCTDPDRSTDPGPPRPAGAPRGSRRRCLRADRSAPARRRTRAESACAPGSRSPAGTASPCSRAPRRPSRRRCRCCPTSRRGSSGPAVSAPDASPSRIIRAAARSFTDPPGFCHSAFAYSSTPGRLALEVRQPHERRAADQVEDGRAGRSRPGRVVAEDIVIYDRSSPNYINRRPLSNSAVHTRSSDDPATTVNHAAAIRHADPARRLALPAPDLAPAADRRWRCSSFPPTPAAHPAPALWSLARRCVVLPAKRSGSGACTTSAPSRGRAASGSGRSSTTGPFALVRNPLYLGNIVLWVGFALSARLLWLAPVIVVAARASSTTRSCGGKKRLLDARLGDAYRALHGARAAVDSVVVGIAAGRPRRRRRVLVARDALQRARHAHRDRGRIPAALAEGLTVKCSAGLSSSARLRHVDASAGSARDTRTRPSDTAATPRRSSATASASGRLRRR